jgi:hypothetical protein
VSKKIEGTPNLPQTHFCLGRCMHQPEQVAVWRKWERGVPVGGGGSWWVGVTGLVPCRGPSGAQVARMRSVCAGGEAALLGPARATYAVTFKSRQQTRVMVDRQWQEVLGNVQVKGVLDAVRNAVCEVHGGFSLVEQIALEMWKT